MPTFSAIKTDVQDYLIDVPTATSNLIGRWVNKAVKRAERNHNFWHMRAELASTTTESTRKLDDLPANWKQLREPPYFIRNDGSTVELAASFKETLIRRSYVEGDTDDEGYPEFLFFDEAEISVYPYPDGASDYSDGEYRIRIPYWAESSDLVNDGDTNWFTDNAEFYLIYYASALGMLFNRDRDEATVYFQLANDELKEVTKLDKDAKRTKPRQLIPRMGAFSPSKRLPPRR